MAAQEDSEASSTASGGSTGLAICVRCAGGHGDVTFAVNLISGILHLRPQWCLSVAACGMASTASVSPAAELSQALRDCGVAQMEVRELPSSLIEPASAHFSFPPSVSHVLFLQGPVPTLPLRAAEFEPLLDIRCGTTKVDPRRSVTVREFGMGAFTSSGGVSVVDCSAGLHPDELGMFPIIPQPLSAETPLGLTPSQAARPFAVVHVRSAKHMHAAARCMLGFAALSGERSLALLCPTGRSFTAKMKRGAGPGAALNNAPDASSDLHLSTFALPAAVQLVVAEEHPLAPGFTASLHSSASRPLPLPTFRGALQHARFSCVTGDASLNEAITLGRPFWYGTAGHKVGVWQALLGRMHELEGVPETAHAAGAVLSWWAWVSHGMEGRAAAAHMQHAGRGTEHPAAQPHDDWPTLLKALQPLGGDWAALEVAFAKVCTALTSSLCTLPQRLVAALEGSDSFGGEDAAPPKKDPASELAATA